MSWFDTSGLTSLAKSALKEAQKTIDKALDIQQEENDQAAVVKKQKSLTEPSPSSQKENSDFFASWGLTSSNSLSLITAKDQPVITQSPSKAMTQSLWGSFTGSFFETGHLDKDENVGLPKDQSQFSQYSGSVELSKELITPIKETCNINAIENKDEIDIENCHKISPENSKQLSDSALILIENDSQTDSGHKNSEGNGTAKNSTDGHPVLMRRSSDRHNSYLNRLSIISSESGKNSSESIEVLGSQSLKTTPDSEVTSLNHSVSTSSSMGLKLASSSVEVIPDSLISPSSIELLGFTHSIDLSRGSDEEFGSPLTSPIDDDKQYHSKSSRHLVDDETIRSNSKSDGSSPRNTDEDIKVLTDANAVNNDDEEASAADDTISYNSISEFTAPTILDTSNILKSSDHAIPHKSTSQYCNEMVDSFGSDISTATQRISEDLPITRAPGRSVLQFSGAIPGSAQSLSTKEFYEKQQFHLLNSSNIINCDNIIQPTTNESFQSLITDSYGSSNDGSWSDRTLNADIDGVIMESTPDEIIVKKAVISEKNNSSFSVKGLLEDAIIDKLSDKTSDSSSYCKISEEVEIHPTWKEGALSSSSHSYEEVDKASSIDHLEHEPHSNTEFTHREPTSPVSSEGRSVDMVKIGSEQTSGHTSGDDLETTTSSDIEIIPSPNGDYGSNYSISRQSPAKLPGKFHKQSSGNVVDLVLGKALASKIRGHNRELSGASNQSNASDESHCSEVERLMKRLSEMAEILESREAKLIEISRNNIELNESNAELKVQVENLSKQDAADVTLITEEYTQRLSALEKKFQQAIREKDVLRKQMEVCKQEAASRMTASELENALTERDETIKELREEGEKLSKQQLHHSTIIKRLRAKEKENEQVIKTLRDKVADQAQELDRLKRSVSAKEAIECTQIETVYKLTTANKKLEVEVSELKGQLDDTNQKFETMKRSFDAAKKEVTELQKNCGDQAKKDETLASLEKEKGAIDAENEQLLHQLEELRTKMRQEEQRWMGREVALRSEVSRQMARAEEAESSLQLSKNDIGGISLLDGTCTDGGVLLAQLAALQESSLERDRRFQSTERRLQQAAAEVQMKLTKSIENNQLLKDECQCLRTKLSSVEINLTHTTERLETCLSVCEEHMTQLKITLESKERLKQEHDNYKQEMQEMMNDLNEKLKGIEENFCSEKAAHEAERRRNIILQEQLKDVAISADQTSGSSLLLARLVGAGTLVTPTPVANIGTGTSINTMDRGENPSPPGSTGRESIASESLGSGIWPADDGDSCAMGSVGGVIGDNSMASSGGLCTLERLQAALQRREGELRAARKAGRRSHAQRTALARELAIHAAELDTMQSLQHQYDALLQMYGEKEEQLQELRLDLQDVKDMYKMQLDEILMLKRQVSKQNSQQK